MVRTEALTVAGKTAVVIGGTSGIGRGIALGFAENGADVVASSRTEERVASVAAELRNRDAETIEQTCDATKPETVASLRDAVVDRFGSVDVLVYAPSYIARQGVMDAEPDEWNRVFDVQLTGAHRATQLFAETMDSGSIIHIASASVYCTIPKVAAYACAKGGLDVLIKMAARELGPAIRVNGIRPGFIRSEQTEGTYTPGTPRFDEIQRRTTTGRLGDPEELVGCAVLLASDANSYLTGEIITVDDGFIAATFEE